MGKKEDRVFVTCEKCGASVRDINLLLHMAKVHDDKEAKEELAYLEKVNDIISPNGLRNFIKDKARIWKLSENDKEGLRKLIKIWRDEFSLLRLLIMLRIPTTGMLARRRFDDDETNSTMVDQVIEFARHHSDDEKDDVGMLLEIAKEMKRETLFESLKTIATSQLDKEKKKKVAKVMVILFPKFLLLVWEKTYNLTCDGCSMTQFKELGCREGDFWCVHDIYFDKFCAFVYDQIGESVASGAVDEPEKILYECIRKAIGPEKETENKEQKKDSM